MKAPTCWSGTLDWSGMRYNPQVDITKDTTTLYASDRDIFLFLVDDTHPIEAGRLPDGSPDLYFRGLYCWNSEVAPRRWASPASTSGPCARTGTSWGVEGLKEIAIRLSKCAASRFAREAAPALENFANSSPTPPREGERGNASSLAPMKTRRASCQLRVSANPRLVGSSRRLSGRRDIHPRASSVSFSG
jgi:hypothetical protein